MGIAIASGVSINLALKVGRRLESAGTLLLVRGMVAPMLTDSVLAGGPRRDAGAASSVLNTIFQVGSAPGVALAGTLFFALLAGHVGLDVKALAAARARGGGGLLHKEAPKGRTAEDTGARGCCGAACACTGTPSPTGAH